MQCLQCLLSSRRFEIKGFEIKGFEIKGYRQNYPYRIFPCVYFA